MDRRTVLAAGLAGGIGHGGSIFAGYEMPLETGPHERTLMQWPVSSQVYDDAELGRVQQTIATIANAISAFEPVAMMVGRDDAAHARDALSGGVSLWDIPTDDLWCRDAGPTFIKSKVGTLAVAHIQFNGWGGKQVHANDGLIAKRVAARLGLPLLASGVVGEGGGIEHDGAGTLLATASCWVNPNRNRLARDDIGRRLGLALGAQKIIWVPGVLGHDITDYHIDALARFVGPGRVLIQLPDKVVAGDPFSRAAYEAYEILKIATDAQGQKLEIIVIPEPVKSRSSNPDFLASYVNFYTCNGAVISAEFGDDRTDRKAHEMLAALYPGRKIITLNVDALGEAGGGIHCATQQQPKAMAK